MSDSPKATLRAGAGQIVAAVGRLANGLRAHYLNEGERIRKSARAMGTVDETAAHGIASLPAMRELLAHDEKRAFELLRLGLNGHYGRPGVDGTRLYLDVGPVYRHEGGISSKGEPIANGEPVARRLYFGGRINDQQTGRSVGELSLTFVETKQGTLAVNANLVKLDEHVRGRGFTGDLMLGLRDYFQRSGVEDVKILAGLTHGSRGWAGVCDWDPDKVVENRLSMIFRMNMVVTEIHHPADRVLLQELQETFGGPPESWPSPRDLLRLEGQSKTLGEQILQDSVWWGKFKL